MPDFETVSSYYMSLTPFEEAQVSYCLPYVLPEFHDPVCDDLYFILSLEFYGEVSRESWNIFMYFLSFVVHWHCFLFFVALFMSVLF